ncbi:MAG: hypothetical protein MZU97_05870 [Bacillus subtilis]|nr:hypothetical protein [Bacillus subtilis]
MVRSVDDTYIAILCSHPIETFKATNFSSRAKKSAHVVVVVVEARDRHRSKPLSRRTSVRINSRFKETRLDYQDRPILLITTAAS